MYFAPSIFEDFRMVCIELTLKDFDPIVCCLKQKIATKIVGVSFNKCIFTLYLYQKDQRIQY